MKAPNIVFSLVLAGSLSLGANGLPLSLMPEAQARPASINTQHFHPGLIADVAETVAPSVVNIDVEKTARVPQQFSALPFHQDILRHFFGVDPGQSFAPFGMHPGMPMQPPVVSGNGSGMILDRQGHILTNNHVIAGADKITVTLNDGRQFPARVVGRDSYSDIAVLKVDAPNLTPIHLGDSTRLRPGEWVIAIGSPLGFDHTVTVGIVSALSRRIPDLNSNLRFIQTDAAINPGNSGGPLVNLKGQVVGVNTAISGKGQNIGFAIPIDMVQDIARTLIAGGSVVRPWLGISMVELNPDLAKHIGLPPTTEGIVIAQVMSNSPAAKAGLRQGDVIQQVDGKPVQKPEVLQEAVRAKPLNSTIQLRILREGQPTQIGLISEALPENQDTFTPIRPRVRPIP